jgi:hypothetical protein
MAMDRQHPARAVKYAGGAAGYQLAELACLIGTVAGERAAHTAQAIAGRDQAFGRLVRPQHAALPIDEQHTFRAPIIPKDPAEL